ncbi:hypothetical protein QAD02_016612 [Eretmocerus hayati]|uniref:Uncharacterized protein n=1 Tax=Eretmocerus hayati TaxID=131215 RepID=A0ACC2PBN4_9HYME|nr:hypothetical protein QAD02_016612 [Eretmocerus hayati]
MLYNITLVIDKPYMITTNIDVADGLTNGSVGKLSEITFDVTDGAKFLWLEFPGCQKIGAEARRKTANYALQHGISRTAVLIGKRTTTINFGQTRSRHSENAGPHC